MRCPNCGEAELMRGTQDLPYVYKEQSTLIKQVSGDYCPVCEEGVLDKEATARVSHEMLEFNKQVNASHVDPDFLVRVRKKLGLDQRQAGELFGGGVNAFSRYENGRTLPPVALVKLFQLLELHPHLLAELTAPSQEKLPEAHL